MGPALRVEMMPKMRKFFCLRGLIEIDGMRWVCFLQQSLSSFVFFFFTIVRDEIVGECGLAMINVREDANVADVPHIVCQSLDVLDVLGHYKFFF